MKTYTNFNDALNHIEYSKWSKYGMFDFSLKLKDDYINLFEKKVNHFPTRLKIIGGCLTIDDIIIDRLPENMHIYESCGLYHTMIRTLPDNMVVGLNLCISEPKIKNLPRNLNVGKDLYIVGTKIKRLPTDLTVGGKIYIRPGQIKKIPDYLKNHIVEWQ